MTAPASYAETIATDVFAQMKAMPEGTWAVQGYNAVFDRMYISDLENLAPAGDPSSQFQIVLAPIGDDYERTGWGAARITTSLGMLFNIAVTTANGEITDPNIQAYERFVDQVCTWLIGARKFAEVWSAAKPQPIKGDHYNNHLYNRSELHIPVLLDFFSDPGGL